MTTRLLVGIMAVLLLLYIVLVGQRAVLLVATGEPIAIVMGVALMVIPLIGLWALARELLFGIRADKLGRRLGDENALPDDELPVRPSGRPLREAADEVFPRYRAEVEQSPEDWRAWYRLGLAYDGAGDRRRARQAIREAISLERRAA
jgi:cytochrome c-type biogenesis protein CcmH/NrfG